MSLRLTKSKANGMDGADDDVLFIASPMSHPSRSAILGAARACFGAASYRSVSMRQIAGEAGLNLPSIYHFFKDKRALYDACRFQALANLAGRLDTALRLHEPAAQRLLGFIEALCEVASGPDAFALLPDDSNATAALAARDLLAAELSRLSDLLGALAKVPPYAARDAARLALALVLGLKMTEPPGAPAIAPDAVQARAARVVRLVMSDLREGL